MTFFYSFLVGLVTMFAVEGGRGIMFDKRLVEVFPLWWRQTSGREAIARIGLSLATFGFVSAVLGKLNGYGETLNSNWWKSSAAIIALVCLRQIWWATNGSFRRKWLEWNATAH